MKNKKEEQNSKRAQHLARKNASKADRRKEKPLERSVNQRDEIPIILIICEGENTEVSYFNHFRVKSAKVLPIGEGLNTLSLVQRAVDIAQKKEYDQLWVVFDKDDFPDDNFNKAIDLAKSNSFGLAYSNQSFEYWLLLHFEDHQGAGMCRTLYNKKINDYIEPYRVKYDGTGNKLISKGFFDLLFEKDPTTDRVRVELAITRSNRNFKSWIETYRNPAKCESCTLVHNLVSEILKYT